MSATLRVSLCVAGACFAVSTASVAGSEAQAPGVAKDIEAGQIAASGPAKQVEITGLAAGEGSALATAVAVAIPNGTAAALHDLATLASEAANATPSRLRGSVRANWFWGHGVSGETCCMCAKRVGDYTVLYAAGDYSHRHGSHSAKWYCEQVCEIKCHLKDGHELGCYDEQHLIDMDNRYGSRRAYQILHEDHFGNIC